jgi:acyl carrier protein
MTETQTKDVLQIIAEILCVRPEAVTPTATFHELNCDSIDAVEIVIEIEMELGIEMSDEEIEGCKTVQDALDLVAKKLLAE